MQLDKPKCNLIDKSEDDDGEKAGADGGGGDPALVKELIDYIQNEAKKFRTGIKYTQLTEVTEGNFKRPKVWSNTRMVVYEFEMVA